MLESYFREKIERRKYWIDGLALVSNSNLKDTQNFEKYNRTVKGIFSWYTKDIKNSFINSHKNSYI